MRLHGENLTVVTVDGHEVVANLKEDGSPRWVSGEWVAYIPENAIVPEDVLKERGYWEADAKKGMLAGSKGNRVKARNFAGINSAGLLFKVQRAGEDWVNDDPKPVLWRGQEPASEQAISVELGQDVTEFLGITEYVPAE